MKRYKRVSKMFLAWNIEKEEEWLRQMSYQGWELVGYNILYYKFKKIESSDYIYKIDYKTTANKDFDEYIQIFKDAGWEHVLTFSGYNYFRIKKELCEYPDIYSDITSKIQRYKSILSLMIILLCVQIPNSINVFSFSSRYQSLKIFPYIQFGLVIILSYAVIKILFKINKIKNSADKR